MKKHSTKEQILSITPSVPCWVEGGYILFDRKFYDGILLYIKEWPGSLRLIMKTSTTSLPAFGIIKKHVDEVPFEFLLLDKGEKIGHTHIEGTSILLASADSYDQLHLSAICNKEKIKCCYIIEYITETRYQINNLEAKNLLINMRRRLFIWQTERRRINAFKSADAIQANGMPAYNAYKDYANSLLYFDTRVNKTSVITDEKLKERLDILTSKSPLKLAFSGRLIAMKGVDDLIEVALKLKEKQIPYELEIFGAGNLEGFISEKIKDHNLTNVTLKGSVDFDTELVPYIKKNIDLYLILHKQSDPSCTYLETLSCGIPIIGYNNKAFSGLLNKVDLGWGVPIGDINGVVEIITNINSHREQIKFKAQKGLELARLHDFETTFKARMNQLKSLTV